MGGWHGRHAAFADDRVVSREGLEKGGDEVAELRGIAVQDEDDVGRVAVERVLEADKLRARARPATARCADEVDAGIAREVGETAPLALGVVVHHDDTVDVVDELRHDTDARASRPGGDDGGKPRSSASLRRSAGRRHGRPQTSATGPDGGDHGREDGQQEQKDGHRPQPFPPVMRSGFGRQPSDGGCARRGVSRLSGTVGL